MSNRPQPTIQPLNPITRPITAPSIGNPSIQPVNPIARPGPIQRPPLMVSVQKTPGFPTPPSHGRIRPFLGGHEFGEKGAFVNNRSKFSFNV